MTLNTNFLSLPPEVLLYTFDFCDEETVKNSKLVCKAFKAAIEKDSRREKCYRLLKKIETLDGDIRKISNEPIISDLILKNPAPLKITSKQLHDYKKKIAATGGLFTMKVYEEIKELLIDALSDLKSETLGKIKADDKEMADILAKAKKRTRGHIYLLSHGLSIYGEKDKNDRNGRKYGNYGLEEGLHPSVKVWISSSKGHYWQLSGHPDLKGFDEQLPVKLLAGKKEGDALLLSFEDKEVKLICSQHTFYKPDMYFEKKMEGIFSARFMARPAQDFTPPLPLSKQQALIENFLNEVKNSAPSSSEKALSSSP